ncbi:MAG TPA: TlpA disulfide reductase family protein [Planctomycetota bacterium]|nr:TlpA disulfide reductase family protein [Planctomycetota bacterium]
MAGAGSVSAAAFTEHAERFAGPEYLSDVLRDWRRAKKGGVVDAQQRLAFAQRASTVATVAFGRERYEALRFVATLGATGDDADLLAARDRAIQGVIESYLDDGDIMGEFVLRVLQDSPHDRALRSSVALRTRSDAVRAACELFPVEPLIERAFESADASPSERDAALAVLAHIAATYPEAKHPLSASTWKTYAEATALVLRELVLRGEPAPEVEGQNPADQRVRLSEQRGKVVLLCFWGDWCSPCRALYERQRELAAKLASRPFTIFGVGSEPERDVFRSVCEKERFSWPNAWDGAAGTAGSIATRWRVRVWPTWYLIDAGGIVRERWLGAPEAAELDAALARWMPTAR